MSPTSIPLSLSSAESAQALLDHFYAQLEGSADLPEALRVGMTTAAASLEKGLALLAGQELVHAKKQEWVNRRAELAGNAMALCKVLKKHRSEKFPFADLVPLMEQHKQSWSRVSHAGRLVDEHSFKIAEYMAAPEAWKVAVDANLTHLCRSIKLLEEEVSRWKKVPAPDSKAPKVEGVVGKAIADCGGKVLDLLAMMGDTSADTDMCLIEEAMIYSDYGKGFQQNDFGAVAKLFRKSKRERDSFLATFTTHMLEASEEFCDAEAQAWIDIRASEAASLPRAPKIR